MFSLSVFSTFPKTMADFSLCFYSEQSEPGWLMMQRTEKKNLKKSSLNIKKLSWNYEAGDVLCLSQWKPIRQIPLVHGKYMLLTVLILYQLFIWEGFPVFVQYVGWNSKHDFICLTVLFQLYPIRHLTPPNIFNLRNKEPFFLWGFPHHSSLLHQVLLIIPCSSSEDRDK